MQPNNGIIYAVLDTKSDMIVGGLQLHRADAAAIRAFGDIASNPETIVSRHPEDFELRRLGFISLHNDIAPEDAELQDDGTYTVPPHTVITGSQWKAAQNLQLADS